MNFGAQLCSICAVGMAVAVYPAGARAQEPGQDCGASADQLLRRGKADQALPASASCLEANQSDGRSLMVKARALAALAKYGESLAVVELALARYPQDTDWRMLKARVLAWKGDLDQAQLVISALGDAALQDDDNLRFSANLAFWRHDWRGAAALYSKLLERSPGDSAALRNRAVCHERIGDAGAARTDYHSLCELFGACQAGQDFAQRSSHFLALVQPSYAVVANRPDEWDILALLEARIVDQFRAGVSADYRSRYFGDQRVSNTYIEGYSAYRHSSGFTAYASAGGTPAPVFSPKLVVQAEPGWGFKFGLEASVRYSYFSFIQGSANVVSPSATYYFGPFAANVRYYLSIDSTNKVSHAVTGKLTYFLGDDWAFFAGGGGGNHADYLEVRGFDTQEFWMVLAGAWWNVTWQHRIIFTDAFRDETSGSQKYIQNYFIVGYQLRM